MLPDAFRQVFTLDGTQLRARASLPCMAVIAAALAVGVGLGRPVIGMIAAGGAMSVGLGSFHPVGRSRVRPMLWASIGMAISALGGSAVGHSGPGAMLNAGVAGFAGGMLQSLGPGGGWGQQQCAIASLVTSGYPTATSVAFDRALLLLAGGLAQTGLIAAYWHFRSPWKVPGPDDPYPGLLPALRTLRANFSWSSAPCRFATRLGLTLTAGAGLAHYGRLTNGYWVPMTALLVIRPDFQQTIYRGLARVGGTLIGAILASLMVIELRPNLLMLAGLIVVFAWMASSTVTVNYGAFSIFLTAYIVFLLAFAGLPERAVVWHRSLNTTFGGCLALLSYVTSLWVWRRSDPPVAGAVLGAKAASTPP
jgi:hypothetical protein